MSYKKFMVILGVVLLTQCKAIQPKPESSVEKMDLYLLIGQSNMAGRAPIERFELDSIHNVFLFTGDEESPWEKAANPLNKYSTIRKNLSMQKLGPGFSFAKELTLHRPNRKIGLIVNARGGTSIEEWEPGANLYNESMIQVKKALLYGNLKGIIWHQGEANSGRYKSYLAKIEILINSLRNDIGDSNLPFVAGQLSLDKPKRKKFNEMILDLPLKVKNTGVVTTENTTTIDKTHFDSESQIIMGKRYANELLKLLDNNTSQ